MPRLRAKNFRPIGPWIVLPDDTIVPYFDEGGNMQVVVGDQTSRPLDLYFDRYQTDTTFAADAALFDQSISVTDATGFVVGRLLTMISNATGVAVAGSQAFITSVVGTTIGLDRPLDNPFYAGDYIQVSDIDMAVDGSVTPQKFTLKKPQASPDIGGEFDITRIMIQMLTTTAPDFGDFGDITALTKGVLFRHTNQIATNYWNIKKNGDIALIAYDMTVYDSSNPALGVYGLAARITYAGQEKHGVALRIREDEDLEFIIQDDLTDLVSFTVMAQGHLVDIPWRGLF